MYSDPDKEARDIGLFNNQLQPLPQAKKVNKKEKSNSLFRHPLFLFLSIGIAILFLLFIFRLV